MSDVTLMQGDCLELMKQLPDGSVDAIICDLPYGTTACNWDSVIPLEPLWAEYKRVTKANAAIVLTASQPFTTALIASNLAMFKYCWAWKKSRGSNIFHAPNMPLKVLEDIAVFSSGGMGHVSLLGERRMPYNPQGVEPGDSIIRGYTNPSEHGYFRKSQANHTAEGYALKGKGYPTTLLEFKSETGMHPTQKPVPLMEFLIRTYTSEGETVLDNCFGSGTTAVACINTRRNFVGMELREDYFNAAKARTAAAQQQGALAIA